VPTHLACRIGVPPSSGERDAWPAVASIALGVFALVFSELIPVGLLADISGHLRVSVGTGGLMVVVPAVAAAVAAPLLTLCSARMERRAVLVGLSTLVLVSDLTRWWPSGAWATGRSPPTARPQAALRPGSPSRRRRTARSMERGRAHNDHAEVTVRGHTEAAAKRKELPCQTRL
jgi:hypothetical protein